MNKIDIITYFDKNYYNLYEIFFLDSYNKFLIKEFNLINHIIDEKNNEDYFESNNWCKNIINRFDVLCHYIKENPNKWAIFSDIDIIFFDNIISEINHCISLEHDQKIFYMPENFYGGQSYAQAKINGGFFLFYCCDEILNFFEYIKYKISLMEKANDQKLIQSMIDNRKIRDMNINFNYKNTNIQIRFGLLNYEKFITNNNPIHSILSNINNTKVFHATSSSGLIEKLQILSSIYLRKNKQPGTNLWM